MEKNCIKYSLFAICVSAFLCMGTAFAASDYHYDTTVNKNYNSQRGKIVYVPQGTTCSAMLLQDINSKTCSKGMNIYATLDKDFLYGKIKIAPAGSTLNGTITQCQSADKQGGNGLVEVRFAFLRTPQGYNIPINAIISTQDKTGILKAKPAQNQTEKKPQSTKKQPGNDLLIPANTRIDIYFVQPVTLSAPRGY